MFALQNELWNCVKEPESHSILQKSLPTYGNILNGAFPYHWQSFNPTDPISHISYHAEILALTVAKGSKSLLYRICGNEVTDLGDRQNYMETHILHARSGMVGLSAIAKILICLFILFQIHWTEQCVECKNFSKVFMWFL